MKNLLTLLVTISLSLSAIAGDSVAVGTAPSVSPRIAVEGQTCTGVGTAAITSTGLPLSCQSGEWKGSSASLEGPYLFTNNGYLGQYTICTLAYTSPQKKQLTYSGGGWYANIDSTNRVYCWR